MNIRQKVMAVAGSALLVAAAAFGGIAIANPGADEAPAQIVQPQQDQVVEPVVEPTPEPTVEPVEPAPVVEPAPAPAPEPPTKCPSGTKANAVDGEGNESACEPLGPSGQPCVAYNDQNVCTEYLEP